MAYDVTNKASFDNLSSWIKFIKEIEQPIIVILGNKIDLGDEKRKVSYSEAEKFAKEQSFSYFEISAKENTNIKHTFFSSISEISYFEPFRKNPKALIEDLEFENSQGNGLLPLSDTSRINISMLPENLVEENKCKC